MLTCDCVERHFDSHSSQVTASDAGDDANLALGDWPATDACHSNAGGSLPFYAAMR